MKWYLWQWFVLFSIFWSCDYGEGKPIANAIGNFIQSTKQGIQKTLGAVKSVLSKMKISTKKGADINQEDLMGLKHELDSENLTNEEFKAKLKEIQSDLEDQDDPNKPGGIEKSESKKQLISRAIKMMEQESPSKGFQKKEKCGAGGGLGFMAIFLYLYKMLFSLGRSRQGGTTLADTLARRRSRIEETELGRRRTDIDSDLDNPLSILRRFEEPTNISRPLERTLLIVQELDGDTNSVNWRPVRVVRFIDRDGVERIRTIRFPPIEPSLLRRILEPEELELSNIPIDQLPRVVRQAPEPVEMSTQFQSGRPLEFRPPGTLSRPSTMGIPIRPGVSTSETQIRPPTVEQSTSQFLPAQPPDLNQLMNLFVPPSTETSFGSRPPGQMPTVTEVPVTQIEQRFSPGQPPQTNRRVIAYYVGNDGRPVNLYVDGGDFRRPTNT